MAMGRVKWFDGKRHFGFLVGEDGGEVFFHETEVSEIDRPLSQGDRVIFQLGEGPRGPVARRVFCVWRAHEMTPVDLAS
ncbi:MAG TPA: cold shock domain-containing protein [Candidatus Methylomirabilis sp.]|jgi:CspA family cold shock protein